MDNKKQRNIPGNIKIKVLVFLFLILGISNALAKEFNSKFNFTFDLPDGYEILNSLNLYNVYSSSHKDPFLKKQINRFKKILEQQNIEILYNFSQSSVNNISILVRASCP